ncbi:sigma-70 family RNA polymerase sigma factor [Vagococcus lutrae]|uniref:sigma-70 family RNA polymerase sigma factor n=1 Tax=Vagococcus lutrae TaxID=81947 RepID=UPI002A835BBF|nr:sigma-70 family RNA polymerase sigma factor [Vagococcus lutrae]MDY3705371.1 sigma-70 family RNA polymerase sigma factor [Vagococcus lutrae]
MKQTNEERINPYIGIVYGVLKQLHIAPNHVDYEDWVQTGLLILCECLEKVSLDFETEERAYHFRGILFRLVKSRMIDRIRQQQRQSRHLATQDDQLQATVDPSAQTEETLIEEADYTLYKQAVWPHLSQRERAYLVATMEKGWTIPEIARYYRVSRHAVYKWRNQLALKSLRYFFDNHRDDSSI